MLPSGLTNFSTDKLKTIRFYLIESVRNYKKNGGYFIPSTVKAYVLGIQIGFSWYLDTIFFFSRSVLTCPLEGPLCGYFQFGKILTRERTAFHESQCLVEDRPYFLLLVNLNKQKHSKRFHQYSGIYDGNSHCDTSYRVADAAP